MAFGLDDIIATALKVVDKFIPDPEAKARAQLEMMQIKQAESFKELEVALQEQQMQADINKVEAASDHIFVAGWRPFMGWICGLGFAMQVIIFPLVATVATLVGHQIQMPEMPIEVLMTTLMGMLGLGYYRTREKMGGLKNGGA